MRTEFENERIHLLAVALLKKRGIAAEHATFEQYADAAEIAAEAVAHGAETVPDMLARAALPADAATPDESTVGVLAKFASDGKFVADLSITEQEYLAAAIAAEQKTDAVVTAEGSAGIDAHGYCTGCGYNVADFGCQCGRS